MTQIEKFCSNCGAANRQEIPAGDNRLRSVCTACNAIHYVNPRIVIGTVAHWQGKILLCKRAIEPRYGFWTLPAGFMECAESTQDGALRETMEEAAYEFLPEALLGVYQWKHQHNDTTYLRFAFIGKVGAHYPMQKLDTGIVQAVWMTIE